MSSAYVVTCDLCGVQYSDHIFPGVNLREPKPMGSGIGDICIVCLASMKWHHDSPTKLLVDEWYQKRTLRP